MESEEAVKKMRSKQKMIEFFKGQRSKSIKTNVGNLGVIKIAKEEAARAEQAKAKAVPIINFLFRFPLFIFSLPPSWLSLINTYL